MRKFQYRKFTTVFHLFSDFDSPSWLLSLSVDQQTENDMFVNEASVPSSDHQDLSFSKTFKPRRMQKKYQCHFCFKWFAGRGVLERHLLIHTGEKPWKCPSCSKAFNRKFVMQRHLLMHMNDDLKKQSAKK